MLVQTRVMKVENGYSGKVVDRFSQDGPMDTIEGLIDRTVMVNRMSKVHEEVMMIVRWQSLEAWQNWEKSDAHIQGHKNAKEKPEYILGIEVNMYEVKVVKKGNSE